MNVAKNGRAEFDGLRFVHLGDFWIIAGERDGGINVLHGDVAVSEVFHGAPLPRGDLMRRPFSVY